MITVLDKPEDAVHIPVLREEIVQALQFGKAATVLDGTLGVGGHAEALLETYPETTVVGLEWDDKAFAIAKNRLQKFGSRFIGVQASYATAAHVLSDLKIVSIDGIVLDLGLSSLQLSDPTRGFSFQTHGPLDMRMSPSLPYSAWDILQQNSAEDIADILWTYGEERLSRRIARALKSKIETGMLENDAAKVAEVIAKAVPYQPGRIHGATRSFQALRMAVNGELRNIDTALNQLRDILNVGGRAAIISFHSLEDRRVKQFFLQAATGCVCPPRLPVCACGIKPWAKLVTRKAIQAGEKELDENPRSRSARLRVLEKIA